MDFRVIVAAFGAVFLAEMADKTQLATVCLATGKSPWSVFVGAASAMVLCSFIAVLAGCVLRSQGAIPTVWIRRGAALLFIAMGIFMMVQSFQPDSKALSPSQEEVAQTRSAG